jgi:glycerol kinase
MILSIDQGTTGTTVLIINPGGEIIGRSYSEIKQLFPRPGWVSHDAENIWDSINKTILGALSDANIRGSEIRSIGITNQRETTLLWNKNTGNPLYEAIVWQCTRTEKICSKLRDKGLEKVVHEKTGLIISPYFSATKIMWLLNKIQKDNNLSYEQICFGTIDSYILYKLTGGNIHATDYTNASRTMIFNIHNKQWDNDLLGYFNIPDHILPEVKPSSTVFGTTVELDILPAGIPISGIAGDQQSALFGHYGVHSGDIKNTYGTGCFIMLNTGQSLVNSNNGLLTTLACDYLGKASYALEGTVFNAGSSVQWLRDGLGIINSAQETEGLAISIHDTGGIYMVPAFNGLGSPYWDTNAKGLIVGITRGTEKKQIVRAALESIAFQSADLIQAMLKDSNTSFNSLHVDGGASANNFLMQFQADILSMPISRPLVLETTALGAGMLAGLTIGVWDHSDLENGFNPVDQTFEPNISADQREGLLAGWRDAINRSLSK